MILIIKTNKEKLHDYEFVKPIEKILKNENIKFFTKHYTKIQRGDLANAKKIIISGTSIQDNEFIKGINHFTFLTDEHYKKPTLGICAGMQIIGIAYDIKKQVEELEKKPKDTRPIKQNQEIGHYKEEFKKEFLGMKKEINVYHLHQNYPDFTKLEEFEIYAGKKIPQAIKHKTKPIYGVLFHPEVRNKQILINFTKE